MPFRQIQFIKELHQHEQICLIIRRHWILLALKIAFWIILLAILGLTESFFRANFAFLNDDLPNLIFSVVRQMFLITTLLGLFVAWVMYYLNVQVITNERIVDITQKSLLNHQTSELNIDRFQDVTTEIKGPLANLFDYGEVRIQTAGEVENFVFNDIPHPHQVAKLVLELYERSRKANPVPPQE